MCLYSLNLGLDSQAFVYSKETNEALNEKNDLRKTMWPFSPLVAFNLGKKS
jgi:hypothetical protein